jgi:signal transduction histidine kinase
MMGSRRSQALALLLGAFTPLLLFVVLVLLIMRPPWSDLRLLALSSGLTALISAFIGYVTHRAGLWRKLGSLSRTITIGYILAAALMLLNVWVTAGLMFINKHDLALAGLLLIFASGISIAFGALLAQTISRALGRIAQAAERVSQGDFSVRVEADGRDEVASLAQDFNEMARRLELAERETRRIESARRDFVAWVSHDLRTPLTSLRAMIEALSEGIVADEATRIRYLRQCQVEISAMSDLIDELFELSRLDAGELTLEFQAASLSDLISDSIGTFRARAEAKGVRLDGRVEDGVDPVRIAPREIGRVLDNLLENALRHTPQGGEIGVHAQRMGETVVVVVSDNGEGVSVEDQAHVFEPFFRGDSSRARGMGEGGAGLGLAIARSLVEAHGGRIWLESDPGQRTTLQFVIPQPFDS